MNAILILNAQSGSGAGNAGRPTAAELSGAFAQLGIQLAVCEVPGASLEGACVQAISRRPDAVFAGGGDGTISSVARHLVDKDIPLGVIPLGTLNHFARDLGLPVDWREAARALSRANPGRVDVAEVNGRVFINNCSLGSYGEAVRRRDRLRRERGHGKWRAMLLASWMVFRNLRRLRLTVDTPTESFALRSPFVLVSNNRYSGHVLDAALRPRLDEGQLCLYSTRVRNRVALLWMAVQTLLRPLDDADGLDLHETTDALVRAHREPIHVACDGELVDLRPPFHFRIRPRALRVLAPTPSAQ